MDLILWRHAEAESAEDGGEDMERPLNSKGERQAERMAAWLDRRMPHSTRILVSPALRCQQTAKRLGRKFHIVADLGPEGDAESLLAAAVWPTASRPALIVGHQPMLGIAASLALDGRAQQRLIRKGGVWWIRSRERANLHQSILHAVQMPDGL